MILAPFVQQQFRRLRPAGRTLSPLGQLQFATVGAAFCVKEGEIIEGGWRWWGGGRSEAASHMDASGATASRLARSIYFL